MPFSIGQTVCADGAIVAVGVGPGVAAVLADYDGDASILPVPLTDLVSAVLAGARGESVDWPTFARELDERLLARICERNEYRFGFVAGVQCRMDGVSLVHAGHHRIHVLRSGTCIHVTADHTCAVDGVDLPSGLEEDPARREAVRSRFVSRCIGWGSVGTGGAKLPASFATLGCAPPYEVVILPSSMHRYRDPTSYAQLLRDVIRGSDVASEFPTSSYLAIRVARAE